MSTFEKMDALARQNTELVEKVIVIWKDEVVFSWRWWFGVAISVLAWVSWWVVHKKESRYRLLTAGFFVMLISLVLDSMGVQLGLWSYRYEVTPFMPAYLPYDLALMPVTIMILIQVKPRSSPVVKGIIFAALSSVIGEPGIVWLDLYKPIHWKIYYSLPIYFIIYLIAHWLTSRQQYEKL
ncbi:CBO0543 family protein [Litchfieldia alkalitelluris]|uniref:CBO0543 family protein n=1 Tax=Litchfieldia alkalitelluris TaxID=304268 RepID=UPI000996363D|nr:CBO0543 family protein [Litchfieldia alkalitelluris]